MVERRYRVSREKVGYIFRDLLPNIAPVHIYSMQAGEERNKN
jgi:hypothetical protein